MISPEARLLADVLLARVDRYVVLVRDPDGDPELHAYGPMTGTSAAIEAESWVRTYAELGERADVSIVPCEQIGGS